MVNALLTGFDFSIIIRKVVLLIMVFFRIFFPIERRVRQGCPVSPYLFIIYIELLHVSHEILSNNNIKGITVDELFEIKKYTTFECKIYKCCIVTVIFHHVKLYLLFNVITIVYTYTCILTAFKNCASGKHF